MCMCIIILFSMNILVIVYTCILGCHNNTDCIHATRRYTHSNSELLLHMVMSHRLMYLQQMLAALGIIAGLALVIYSNRMVSLI